MKKKLLLLLFIIGIVFRFYQLTKYPVSLSMDETAIGYNAYSILKTGRDEWGEFLPLAFKSVGDYKPPVNVYLTVPFIAIFGLTEFATRLPSALIGSLTIIFIVLLLLKLKIKPTASYLTGLWLSILPWHIHFSRASFEAVTALFFLILGTYLFISWVEKNKLATLISSVVAFSLSVWSYHAERLLVPIFVVTLIILYGSKINLYKTKKQLCWALLVLAIFTVPFLKLSFFTPAIKTRATVTSIFRETTLISALHHGNYQNIQEFIFDNDAYIIFRHWLSKYLNYFNFEFIFWNGMQFTQPGYPGVGLLYFIDLPLFFIGIYYLFKKNSYYLSKITLIWLILGPLPASFAMNEQHPLRALVWIPALALIIAHGFEFITKSKFKKIIFFVYYLLLFINIIYFIDIYKYQSPKHFSEYWQYGYKQIAQFACEHKDKYDEIIISETFGSYGPLNTGLPYLYVLFYCQSDPKTYYQTRNIDKISFHRITWSVDSEKPNRLLIAAPWDFLDTKIPENQIIKKIDFLNGKTGFLFVETIPKNVKE